MEKKFHHEVAISGNERNPSKAHLVSDVGVRLVLVQELELQLCVADQVIQLVLFCLEIRLLIKHEFEIKIINQRIHLAPPPPNSEMNANI
jgi:hypothetical protein